LRGKRSACSAAFAADHATSASIVMLEARSAPTMVPPTALVLARKRAVCHPVGGVGRISAAEALRRKTAPARAQSTDKLNRGGLRRAWYEEDGRRCKGRG
jgi:hypothetical protein